MSRREDLTRAVKEMAGRIGFARVGIAPAGPVPHAERLEAWLADGYHAGMAYMARNLSKRVSPQKLVPGARSVISLAFAYAADARPGPCEGVIARYARGRDYHKVLKRRCRRLTDEIRRLAPELEARAFVDSAPVMERSLAAAAGVGWIGRNAMLIVPGLGSYVLLCEIICNLSLPADAPIPSQCGNCNACVESCPTGAIDADGLVDARRCISYLTVEHRGRIDREFWPHLGNRLFGCDICQEACPHNRQAAAGADEPSQSSCMRYSLAEVLGWTEADWAAATRGTALRRAGYEKILRNACLAAGNSADSSLRRPLADLGRRADALREEIDWALSRLPV
jgi:epoxyqueuosine reductase